MAKGGAGFLMLGYQKSSPGPSLCQLHGMTDVCRLHTQKQAQSIGLG